MRLALVASPFFALVTAFDRGGINLLADGLSEVEWFWLHVIPRAKS